MLNSKKRIRKRHKKIITVLSMIREKTQEYINFRNYKEIFLKF